MAQYTITIKNLIKNNFNFKLDEYPIFDETYRQTLNTKILNHYYENEIGFETPALFNHYLNAKMNEIMPFYNNLYNAQIEALKNILGNVNLTEKLERNVGNTGTSQSNSNNQGKNIYQDTPQGRLVQDTIDTATYATSMTLNGNNINDTTNTSGNMTEEYLKTIIGNNGNKYNIDLLNDIKNKLLNIDLLIIDELNDLFMGLL